jgi:glucose/arabinose dehydrogenase
MIKGIFAIFVYIILFTKLNAYELKFEEIYKDLNSPWSLSFLDNENIILTEKSGNLLTFNLIERKTKKIEHNLNILEDGQGGLLDVFYYKGYIFVSYAENRGKGKSSTSVAKGKYNNKKINFKNIFRSEPPIKSGYHFGSRLAVKDNHIFITVGERGLGMIAQDPTQHPGSVIRVNLDGSIPKDNPKFKNRKNWLPEIFQIGVRNPQGLALSKYDDKIYLSNHGARGGDWFGQLKYGENYGWKILGWGGRNYTGSEIGPKWKLGFTKPIIYWIPSIAVSAILIYRGEEFKEWNGDALISSLKDQSLRKIKFKDNLLLTEEIIFKNKIGRIRDIKIKDKTGELFLLSDSGSLWRLYK